MKLWKSKKSATTSCVSAVSGKLNLSGNKNYKDEDKIETISAASTATPTNQMANGLHQGNKTMCKVSSLSSTNLEKSEQHVTLDSHSLDLK
jgi:hypothetical protein